MNDKEGAATAGALGPVAPRLQQWSLRTVRSQGLPPGLEREHQRLLQEQLAAG